MSISLLYMPVKFKIEIAKDDKKFDFSLGGDFFLAHPVYTYSARISGVGGVIRGMII